MIHMATKVKKSALVTPPIDNRETFVSLSKNMADTDMSMEVKLHTLYKIQEIDTKIDRIHLLRGELPEEVSDLEDKIEGLKTRLAKFQTELKDTEKSIAQRKNDIEAAQALIAKYEEQRGNVRNNREYDSLTKEIEFQDLEKQLANKRIAESNAFLTEKKAEIEKTKQEIEGREADLKLKKEELVSIIDETAKEEEQLLKDREALAATLDQRMMVAYTKVRSNARNRLAVVTVKRDACGGCFNKIPPQRQLDIALSKKIIVCEYCGRILVSSEFEKE